MFDLHLPVSDLKEMKWEAIGQKRRAERPDYILSLSSRLENEGELKTSRLGSKRPIGKRRGTEQESMSHRASALMKFSIWTVSSERCYMSLTPIFILVFLHFKDQDHAILVTKETFLKMDTSWKTNNKCGVRDREQWCRSCELLDPKRWILGL